MSYPSPAGDRWSDTPSFRYQLLRQALREHGTEPANLGANALTEITARAAAHCRWQALALGSPEAAQAWVPEEQIDHAMGIIEKRFADREQMTAALGRAGLTLDNLRKALVEELRAEAVAEGVVYRSGRVSEGMVRDYFDAHPEQFVQPERRAARHILITINPAYPDNRPAAALNHILEVAAAVGDTVEGFAAQALRHSECPSALGGGRLGWVYPGTLYTKLDRTLFKLAEGAVSNVAESPLGYHLLRCDAVQPARSLEFPNAAPGIRNSLEEKQRRRALRDWAATLPPQPGKPG